MDIMSLSLREGRLGGFGMSRCLQGNEVMGSVRMLVVYSGMRIGQMEDVIYEETMIMQRKQRLKKNPLLLVSKKNIGSSQGRFVSK